MGKLVNAWNEKVKLYEKIAFVIGLICSVLVIILSILQLTGIMETALNIAEPLLGVLMITQGILFWKKNKPIALFSFAVAIFICVTAIFIFFIR